MRPNRQFFLVEIDLKKQKKKMESIEGTSLVAPTGYEYMKYYLQAAPIIAIGEDAAKWFPEAKVGDILIFHHTVEDDDWRLVHFDVEKEIEWRVVEGEENSVFGIQKLIEGIPIIPSKPYLWCKTIPLVTDDGWKKIAGVYLPEESLRSEDAMRLRIEDIEHQIEFVSGGQNAGQIITELKKEQAVLTHLLNRKYLHELELVNIHQETSKRMDGVEKGDHVFVEGWINFKGYPLSVDGQEYLLCRKQFVAMALKKKFLNKVA